MASSSTAPFMSTFWWRVTAFRPCRSTSSTARCRWRWRTYPAELARLCSALEIEYQKDREGALLMRQMARPRKNRKGEKGIHWVFDAEKLARLITYCAHDTRCCRAVWTHPR